MNKLINFLRIQITILTEFKPQEEINLATIITTLCCILIVFLLIFGSLYYLDKHYKEKCKIYNTG
jgi:TRAP-type C4-dicarboxylate transport system permease small subunit